MNHPQARAVRRGRRPSLLWRNAWAGLLFVAPVLVLFVMFKFLPIAGTAGISFSDFRLTGQAEFIGLENYERLIADPVFWSSLGATLIYVVVFVPLMLTVAILSALLLNSITRFVGTLRVLLFIPYATSFVIAGIIWKWMYSVDGPLNTFLGAIGVPPVGFLTGEQVVVLASLAVVSVWRGFGYAMLIALAGLKSQSAEVHEAARIDGANRWQHFWLVTLPMLRPVVFFLLVIETIIAFQVFDTMYTMTGGGPSRASYSLVYFLYDTGFRFFDFGYAATIGVAIFLIVLALSLIQRRFFGDRA